MAAASSQKRRATVCPLGKSMPKPEMPPRVRRAIITIARKVVAEKSAAASSRANSPAIMIDFDHQVNGPALLVNLSLRLRSRIHVTLSRIGERKILETSSDASGTERFTSLKRNKTSQDFGRYGEWTAAICGLDSNVSRPVL